MFMISAGYSNLANADMTELQSFVACARGFDADIHIISGNEQVDAKSLFGLCAAELKECVLTICAEGRDERTAAQALCRMLRGIA